MADLTTNVIPKATGATQIDNSSISDDGTIVTITEPVKSTYVNASVLGAAIVNAGTGGTLGAATLTGTTGTGTKFQAAVTITNSVTAAVVNNAGDGSGTPGPVTITGITGTGTPFQATGTVDGSGLLAGALTVTVHGSYTVNPTTTNEAVTSDAGLVGATVDLILAGGALSSVDSISVAGSYTVPPTDPANEPVTGGGLTGAVLALEMSFAPSIVGSDATSGVVFAENSLPGLSILSGADTVSFVMSPEGEYYWAAPGPVVSSPNGYFGFSMVPAVGTQGEPILAMDGYGAGNYPIVALTSANGVVGAPTKLLTGQLISEFSIAAHNGTTFSTVLVVDVKAVEDFSNNNQGVSYLISNASKGSNGALVDHFLIDGDGITNTTPTPRAISALPASPVAGMIATVNDAMTPTVGLAIASGGAASAVVCYGGTQWTVISI